MNSKLSGLTLGLLVATLASNPAMAGGDVIYTGIKDPYAAAVPVPAPIPVAEYDPEYYFRLDVGGAWLRGGEIDEIGTGTDIRSDDIEAIEFGGIGVGRYVTPSIRVELSVDLHNKGLLSNDEASVYVDSITVANATDPTLNDTRDYDVSQFERIKYEQDLALFNVYYDFKGHSRFTPYIGVGLGVTYRTVERTTNQSASCRDTNSEHILTDNVYDPAPPFSGNPCAPHPTLADTQSASFTDTESRWDIAAAAMAGFSMKVYDNIHWDNGYRFVWQNGTFSSVAPTAFGSSKVEVGDVIQHQFRTGLRFDIN